MFDIIEYKDHYITVYYTTNMYIVDNTTAVFDTLLAAQNMIDDITQ